MRMYLTGFKRLSPSQVLLTYEATPGERNGEQLTKTEDVDDIAYHAYGEAIEITIQPITEG